MYNLKDLIRINQELGQTGQLRDSSSLQSAISIVKEKKSWLFELSYLVRSLLIDHPFIDGNKRVALMLITIYFFDNKLNHDKYALVIIVHQIARKNIIDINKISRLILKCLI